MSQKELVDNAILKFIDAYVDLNNEIGLKVLMEQFSIHRARASSMLAVYKEEKGKPSNLRYNLSKKRYEKGLSFMRLYLLDISSFDYITSIHNVFGEPCSTKSK